MVAAPELTGKAGDANIAVGYKPVGSRRDVAWRVGRQRVTGATLHDELIALAQECDRAAQEAKSHLKALEAERESIEAELRQLTERLNDIDLQIERQIESARQADAARTSREARLVNGALWLSRDAIAAARADWKTLRKLTAQYRALARKDPGLEQALQHYLDFEKSRPDLDTLPVLHRQALLNTQEALHKRVAPYLTLRDAAAQLWRQRPLVLQLAVARDPERGRIYWIVALPQNLQSLPDGLGEDLSDFMVAVVNGIRDCGGQPGWFFKQVMMRGWAGFTEVMAVDVRTGRDDLAALTQSLVQARLNNSPLHIGEAIEAQVAEITFATWRAGRDLPASRQPSETDRRAAAPTPVAGGAADSGQWYSDDDLRYWNRPFTANLNILWNAQARRLRTLLTRLVDRGIVGDTSTPLEALWKSLPAPDDREMLAGIERLIEKSLLVEHSDGLERRVAINPELIEEARNLINREMTEFWSDIFGEQLQQS